MQRRTLMKGGVGAALASIMGIGLAGCGSDDNAAENPGTSPGSGEDQEQQVGMHPDGPTYNANGMRPADEVRKEVAAHGVSVVHIKRDSEGNWDVVFGSPFNRRITGNTEMDIRGPVRGYRKLSTRFSQNGTRTRGTLNNCSMGPTPWGTYLAAEENWHGYFANSARKQPREQVRHGVGSATRYDWELADGGDDQYARFNVTPIAKSAADDYRNEANTFGYMVEIDPFTPESKPQKRTALGTLYVARFNDDGSGDWLPLTLDDPAFVAKVEAAQGSRIGNVKFEGFENQADVLLNTRLAADIAGATPMDRPEWGAVDPNTGEVYFTLTNNSQRTEEQVNAANPRANNRTGHIIRWLVV